MVIVARLKVKSGTEAEMERAFREMMPKVEQEEGTLAYAFHRAQNDPTVFLVYEKYKDKAAFDYHCSTPYFQELFGTLGALLDGQPTMEIYDEVTQIRA